ncbi:DNA repair protein XRCC2-like [Seriola lalandi dorsalis]|uniref:DNA repair protein XRCC2-like n=1 Tax=Seriola lalandi dorsalis TaxID=1841481 RepID=UPI000C6F9551|nr:DNA repair protein XRCC2-like [Seriola lalandi dorsalis]
MSESGAQLFARLEARRCLKDIEPRLFPEDGGPDHGDCPGPLPVSEEKLSKCSELLGRLLRDYRITVFATCHAIRRSFSGPTSSSSSSSLESDRPYLCRPWQRLVTHRLLCSRQEAANNTAATAGGSKEQRRQQVFTVHCTSSSTSSSRTKAYRSSAFYVTDGGVEFI